jgi:hypothetical protein
MSFAGMNPPMVVVSAHLVNRRHIAPARPVVVKVESKAIIAATGAWIVRRQ